MTQERFISKIYGNIRIYDENMNDWVYIRNSNIGDTKHSLVNNDHDGWLVCDGRSLLRTEYPLLFDLIGTSFGNINSTTFKLPDARGRNVSSIGTGVGLSTRSNGQNIGNESHTLSITELPSHNHTGTTDSSGSHTHTSNANGGNDGVGLVQDTNTNTASSTDTSSNEFDLYQLPVALTINSAGAHTHTFTTGSTGSGGSFSLYQPTLFMGNTFIFAKVV